MQAEVTDTTTLAHSEFLWTLSERRDLPLSDEDRQRLRDASILMKYRPDIDMSGDFQFEVGKTYPTRGGQLVTIVSKTDSKGYECVQGDDGDRPQGGYRYSRSTGTGDHGRCTASRGDDDRNLLPIEIVDPRITKIMSDKDLLARKAADVTTWLDTQYNPTGEEPDDLNVNWMDRTGFTAGEVRAAKIAVGHLVGTDTYALREKAN
ncbi:hypothetical protein G6L37_06590 [Agrobacterium rubi]|nr:hypothetical protein [Agrobacterium rubi]NTF25031.1 hypothetical protein [Agrobacterium rubi]